jgi:hypothetical protein
MSTNLATLRSDPARDEIPDALRAIKDRNEEAFAREFAETREVLSARPIQVDFETTTRCNIRCFTCPKTYSKDKGRDAGRELFDKLAAATFDTARSVNLTGFGEPMMSPHFEYFYGRSIEASMKRGWSVLAATAFTCSCRSTRPTRRR